MHIANPVLPIKVNPPSNNARKKTPKAKDMKIDAIERVEPSSFVYFGEYETLRAGFENGVLKSNVVKTKITKPKYHNLYSVQTPRLLE